MVLPRLEYWSGLPFPSPGIFLTQGLNLCLYHLLRWQGDSLYCPTWGARNNSWHLVNTLTCVWRRHWHPTPVLLPGKSHGQRSLVGCSPWGREESDTTERLHLPFALSCIGEGNGNPLQCSCLENPRDGGAWWAAVYGVTQSRTRLKRLSSSSKCLLNE